MIGCTKQWKEYDADKYILFPIWNVIPSIAAAVATDGKKACIAWRSHSIGDGDDDGDGEGGSDDDNSKPVAM